MDSLDTLASRMVMRARQVERALHDPGPWKVRTDNSEYTARKVIGDDHVTFFALIAASRTGVAELTCAGDVIATNVMDPMDEVFQVEWCFAVEDPVIA